VTLDEERNNSNLTKMAQERIRLGVTVLKLGQKTQKVWITDWQNTNYRLFLTTLCPGKKMRPKRFFVISS